MRILVLTSLYPPHYLGGYEVSCKAHADELARRGHEVFVLTSKWGVQEKTVRDRVFRLLNYSPERMGVKAKQSRLDPLGLARRIRQLSWALAQRQNYRTARRIVREVKPDIAYAWQLGAVSLDPALAAQDEGIPIVFNLGDYWLTEIKRELDDEPSSVRRWYRKAVLGSGNINRLDLRHMLVISDSLKRSYTAAGFPDQSFTVIPRGISSHLVQSHENGAIETSQGEVRLIFAGRLVPEKGVDLAIEAVAHLKAQLSGRRVCLDIVGVGRDSYLQQLKEMTRSKGLEDNVRFTGKLDRQLLLEAYPSYHALLFPSRWPEPFGITIIEAMARGLAVIAVGNGGVSEIITDRQSGLLVPSGDAEAIARAVRELVEDRDLAARIRSTALRLVRDKYSLDSVMDQTECYLETAARERKSLAA